MPYIQPAVVAKAREMDLLTYLHNYEPQELVHFGGNTYCTRAHDSLKISNGKWCWFSRGIGGVSALDYLIKVENVPFTEAVERIVGRAAVQPPVLYSEPKVETPKTLLLPKANRNSFRAEAYLAGRGIDQEIVDFCVQTGRIYESAPYHNVVFVGRDKDGAAKYASLRGIGTDFIGDANGSDKRYSFAIPTESSTVHLFESAIDLLSFATLLKQSGRDWRQDNLLSLAGVYKPRSNDAETRLPAALKQFLSDRPHVQKVVLRLDADQIGQQAAVTIQRLLKAQHGITAEIRPPPQGKDYNDFLCIQQGLSITKRREKSRER